MHTPYHLYIFVQACFRSGGFHYQRHPYALPAVGIKDQMFLLHDHTIPVKIVVGLKRYGLFSIKKIYLFRSKADNLRKSFVCNTEYCGKGIVGMVQFHLKSGSERLVACICQRVHERGGTAGSGNAVGKHICLILYFLGGAEIVHPHESAPRRLIFPGKYMCSGKNCGMFYRFLRVFRSVGYDKDIFAGFQQIQRN